MSVIQVDPSLYTGPYDAALTTGLLANSVQVRWAARPARPDEACDLPRDGLEHVFAGAGGAKSGGAGAKLRSGLGYLTGWRRLLAAAERLRPDVIHLQWPLLPAADLAGIRAAQATAPVVITVHDLTPFNGAPASRLQLMGFQQALRAADGLVVHTAAARGSFLDRGFDPARVNVVPHGPLLAPVPEAPRARTDPRWTYVLFGKIQPYKGIDLLLDAVAAMPAADRTRCRVIVAGEPVMPAAPLLDRAAALGLSDMVELRLSRHSENEMAALFEEADGFVFPYRQIEASGVFAMLRGSGKWMVASDLGAFREALAGGDEGALTPSGDVAALSRALADGIGRRPAPAPALSIVGWTEIGARTRAVYESVIAARRRPGRAA